MVFLLLPDGDHKSDINFLCIIQNEDIKFRSLAYQEIGSTRMS